MCFDVKGLNWTIKRKNKYVEGGSIQSQYKIYTIKNFFIFIYFLFIIFYFCQIYSYLFSSNSKMASFVDSQKGGKKLIYEGHLYQKHFERGQDIYWRCDLYKSTHCSGRAKTRSLEENTAVELGNQHNHAPSPARCEAWKINRAVRATAISSFGNAPRTVTNECLAGA